MDNKGFLSRFRRSDMTAREMVKGSVGRTDIRFRLDFGDEGATVTVVNQKGDPLSQLPDYRLYQGEVFNVLRVLDDIQQTGLYSMNWSGGDLVFNLRNEPTLLFALLRCDRLVDSQMNSITVSGTKYRNLINAGYQPTVPVFTCTAPMTVSFGGETFNLLAGRNYNRNLTLQPGDNIMLFSGNGNVNVNYREVYL